MKKRKLTRNLIASIALQIITIVSGLILPRFILRVYGSEINGLVSSISQFISVISFMELGVGAVVQSALYKPLVDRDNRRISEIYVSANNFFRTLAWILFFYICVLVVLYPLLVEKKYGFLFSATLIISMSISWFAQYYYGIVNGLLLKADQKGYVLFWLQSITIIINTIVTAFLMIKGFGIHLVKLSTSLIYLFRPIFLSIYVNKTYSINKDIVLEYEPISQKWNGVAQHIAAVILDSTDTIILTLFSSLSNVSIYSIYYLIVNGLKQFSFSVTYGFQSLVGELFANNKTDELVNSFTFIEWIIHFVITIIYGCTATLIVPFVLIYTSGVTDANYNVPLFAFLITIGNLLHCLRMPYFEVLIKGCNFYKETQSSFVIAAIMNIFISIMAVLKYDLIGVAIGTIITMLYQTTWMAYFCYNIILHKPKGRFWKLLVSDFLVLGISYLLCFKIQIQSSTYLSWVIMAIKVTLVYIFISIIINGLFFYNYFVIILNKLLKKRK